MLVLYFFFFQAEDGIRDYKVTGVQTCALPICEPAPGRAGRPGRGPRHLRALPATEPRLPAGEGLMENHCAVIGIGQTRHASKRDDVSIAGLVREAALRADRKSVV